MTSPQRTRPLKKCFHRHSKKFGRVPCPVCVEQGRYAALIGSAQRCKLGSHHGGPSQLLFACRLTRHSMGCVIFEVELVSQLVEDNVLTVSGISRAMFYSTPGQNQRTHSSAGLAKATHSALFPKMFSDLSFLFHHVRHWIDKNREQP